MNENKGDTGARGKTGAQGIPGHVPAGYMRISLAAIAIVAFSLSAYALSHIAGC